MTVLEMHPDDLLDRELRGELTESDQLRLDAHLARCASCRLERTLRADFDEELSAREEAPSLQIFVSGALRAARASEKPPVSDDLDGPRERESHEREDDAAAPPRRAPSRAPSRFRRQAVVLLVASLAFGIGVAAAKSGVGGRAFTFVRKEVAELFRASGATSQVAAQPAGEVAAEPAGNDVRAERATSEREAAGPETAEGPRVPATPSSPRRAHELGSAKGITNPAEGRGNGRRSSEPPAPSSTASAPREVPGEPGESIAPSDSASALFDKANRARREGGTLEASALYRELRTKFPSSPEATLSLVLVAKMQLDRGESASALNGFDSYLATHDRALREEAMQGRALALSRLGRVEDERQAWRELLAAHPNSTYAQMARARLGGAPE